MVKTQKNNNSGAKLDLTENSWEDIDNLWDDVMGEEKQSRPSYYAILPADVRYDPKLTHLEKILYSEITVLSNRLGYCYATNKWFADLYNNSDRTIRKSINHLAELGYISTTVEGVNRKIYLNPNKLGGRKPPPTRKKTSPLGGRKLPHNNTSIIIQDNTISKESKPEEKCDLPDIFGKNYIQRLVSIYHLAWKYKLGTDCLEKISGRTGMILKKLRADYNEYEIASMIFLHFEWKGANNDSDYINKRLNDNSYPLFWIDSSAMAYQTFLRDKLGIKDSKQLKEHVDRAIDICRGAI